MVITPTLSQHGQIDGTIIITITDGTDHIVVSTSDGAMDIPIMADIMDMDGITTDPIMQVVTGITHTVMDITDIIIKTHIMEDIIIPDLKKW